MSSIKFYFLQYILSRPCIIISTVLLLNKFLLCLKTSSIFILYVHESTVLFNEDSDFLLFDLNLFVIWWDSSWEKNSHDFTNERIEDFFSWKTKVFFFVIRIKFKIFFCRCPYRRFPTHIDLGSFLSRIKRKSKKIFFNVNYKRAIIRLQLIPSNKTSK